MSQEEYTYFETFIIYLFDSKIMFRRGKVTFLHFSKFSAKACLVRTSE